MTEEEPIYAEPQSREHALHLGMWVFLGSETLLFAGLFGLYSAYRAWFPRAFAEGVAHNHAAIGTANTLVLIVSSFFVAWSIHALRRDRRRTCLLALTAAVLLGLTFLGLKTLEYSEHLAEGIAPGAYYSSSEVTAPGSQMFFTLYYVMTGLHAIHVIAGLTLLVWLISRVARRRTTAVRHVELELSGLYWHLVDVVWIFLWPLLYLTR
ncbi:MAG: cytochrome c oxidase subunit 3 family protein [Kofleriaceae bacterium]